MTECFRNTRQIVETAFNVLYGSVATQKDRVPTKAFGDIAALEQKGLLEHTGGIWRVRFARRDGLAPRVTIAGDKSVEEEVLISRLRWLVEEQEVRPEDIHVLACYRNRVERLAEVIQQADLPSVNGVHVAITKRDELLHRRGWISVSTVASAKGYDAYCVLLASANDFPTDVQGRASFYVGCTRAIEYLEVLGHRRTGLVAETGDVLARLD